MVMVAILVMRLELMEQILSPPTQEGFIYNLAPIGSVTKIFPKQKHKWPNLI